MLKCRDFIHDAFQLEADNRSWNEDWEAAERLAMAKAANDWAAAHGLNKVTVHQIEDIEHLAVGHIDYATKIALYIAEMVYGVREVPDV